MEKNSKGTVTWSLRRGRKIILISTKVTNIKHTIIATDAVVESGMSVLRSAALHWIIHGIVQPQTDTKAVALKQNNANCLLSGGLCNSGNWSRRQQSTKGSLSCNRHKQDLPRKMGLGTNETADGEEQNTEIPWTAKPGRGSSTRSPSFAILSVVSRVRGCPQRRQPD